MTIAETLSTERIFDGKVFDLERDRVKMPNGREVTVDIVRHSKSVVLLPLPSPREIILIRQYRYAVNRYLWELPAGSVDKGEEPEDSGVLRRGDAVLSSVRPERSGRSSGTRRG